MENMKGGERGVRGVFRTPIQVCIKIFVEINEMCAIIDLNNCGNAAE